MVERNDTTFQRDGGTTSGLVNSEQSSWSRVPNHRSCCASMRMDYFLRPLDNFLVSLRVRVGGGE
jgi:hypothetical protein